jgi:hypothetical protein
VRLPKVGDFTFRIVIGISIAVLVVSLIADAVFCSILPPFNQRRTIAIYDDNQTVRFDIRGTLPCIFSTEGPFPEWHQHVTVKFKQIGEFQSPNKSMYRYGEDFEGDTIRGGGIVINETENSAMILLEFVESYKFQESVNGTYSLIEMK